MHGFYPIGSNEYKGKDEGGVLEVPPHTMETDKVNTCHQDSIVIFGDDAVVGMPQRRSSQKAAHTMNDVIKSLLLSKGGSSSSWAGGAPKIQAVGSPQAREFDSTGAMYVLKSESKSEDFDMCMPSDDEGPALSPSNRISTNDWEEDHHTSLGMCTAILKRNSLGPDYDAI